MKLNAVLIVALFSPLLGIAGPYVPTAYNPLNDFAHDIYYQPPTQEIYVYTLPAVFPNPPRLNRYDLEKLIFDSHQKLAESGDTVGLHLLGEDYLLGDNGVQIDYKKATDYLQQAVNKGMPWVQSELDRATAGLARQMEMESNTLVQIQFVKQSAIDKSTAEIARQMEMEAQITARLRIIEQSKTLQKLAEAQINHDTINGEINKTEIHANTEIKLASISANTSIKLATITANTAKVIQVETDNTAKAVQIQSDNTKLQIKTMNHDLWQKAGYHCVLLIEIIFLILAFGYLALKTYKWVLGSMIAVLALCGVVIAWRLRK